MKHPVRQKHIRDRLGDRRGVALMLALVFVVLLAAIVVEFSFDAQVDASLAFTGDSQFQAYTAARSAVAEGMALLAADLLQSIGGGIQPDQATLAVAPPGEYDSYWDATPWAGGAPMKPMNDAMMRTTIRDEYGKLNLNALFYLDPNTGQPVRNEWLIQALRVFFQLRDPELGYDPVDAIIDWVDYGDEGEEPEGAEAEYYEGLEIPYPIKNGPMDDIEELLLIKGITPELYYGKPEDIEEAEENEELPPVLPLSEYLTVHGQWEGKVNANTAEYDTLLAVLSGYREVSQASEYDPQLVADRIFEYQYSQKPITDLSELNELVPPAPVNVNDRRNQPNRPANPAPDGNANKQRNRPGAENQIEPQPQTPQTIQNQPGTGGAAEIFTISSSIFRIYGDGMMDDTLVRVAAVVWRSPFNQSTETGGGTNDPFRIIDWKVIE